MTEQQEPQVKVMVKVPLSLGSELKVISRSVKGAMIEMFPSCRLSVVECDGSDTFINMQVPVTQVPFVRDVAERFHESILVKEIPSRPLM